MHASVHLLPYSCLTCFECKVFGDRIDFLLTTKGYDTMVRTVLKCVESSWNRESTTINSNNKT